MLATAPAERELALMASILDSKNELDFGQRCQNMAKSIGFDTYAMGIELTRGDGSTAHHLANSYPDAWRNTYEEQGYLYTDPTVGHCQQTTAPLIWNEKLFTNAGRADLLEESRSHGVSHGISISLHEASGRKSMLSLVRDQSIQQDAEEESRLVAFTKVMSACVHVAANRLFAPAMVAEGTGKLTKQEKECLQWSAKGKTSWETGQIMNVSEPTVVFHFKNVMKKLNATNRIHAVVIAMRLGIVH